MHLRIFQIQAELPFYIIYSTIQVSLHVFQYFRNIWGIYIFEMLQGVTIGMLKYTANLSP